MRILVVEDDPQTLSVTLDLLTVLGHWATGVTSAESALNRFLEGAFDVLMTDVGLPALSGRELAEAVLQRHTLPVIFASGHPRPVQMGSGAIWLSKPYSVEQLREALHQAGELCMRNASSP